MLVKLKTLKGDMVEVEAALDMPVKTVKERACETAKGKEGGWELEGLKLIFQGKVLDNDKDVASYGIKENEFMVVMASKPKAAPAAAPAAPAPAAAAPAASPAPAAAAPAPAAPAPAGARLRG